MPQRSDNIENAKPLDLDRCYAASDRQRDISRRTQALLAAAGMDKPARRWFVATVDQGADRKAAGQMAKSGIEVWMPTVMALPRRRSGMGSKPRKPLETLAICGYLFVKVEATADSWHALATIDGFVGMLGSNGRPTPVREDKLNLYKSYLAGDPEAVAIVTNAVRLGDNVIVDTGPYSSLPGTVSAMDAERGRAIVDIILFGRVNPVHLDVAQIRKL